MQFLFSIKLKITCFYLSFRALFSSWVKYLNRCEIEGNKVVAEEKLLKNVGRVRNVKMGPDGYIYVAVEKPGIIYKVVPL